METRSRSIRDKRALMEAPSKFFWRRASPAPQCSAKRRLRQLPWWK